MDHKNFIKSAKENMTLSITTRFIVHIHQNIYKITYNMWRYIFTSLKSKQDSWIDEQLMRKRENDLCVHKQDTSFFPIDISLHVFVI